ncbi:MAG: hypothetical protein U0168_06710 [Nannocystaceae bacterium]
MMESDATLGVFCRRFGVPLHRRRHRAAAARGRPGPRARDLILTGRAVGAIEAHAIGLVDRVAAPGQARAAAESLAAEIAALPQTCLRSDRRAVYGGLGQPLLEAMRHEFECGTQVLRAADFVAGPQRFRDGAGRHGQGDPG